MRINYSPIGIIHSPHTEPAGMPIQPAGAQGIRGTIAVFPQYAEGLKDLDGFSHVVLLYHLHKSEGYKLTVTPFLDTRPRGLFSTRAPKRPNPIGLSVVKLLSVDENILTVENLDILDGTPLLDLKPYVPEFDSPTVIRLGWLEQARGQAQSKRSDDRFE
jgi:tRNA-Thr(GGU) m(6)t(6)A37 methyltransferase TsaA